MNNIIEINFNGINKNEYELVNYLNNGIITIVVKNIDDVVLFDNNYSILYYIDENTFEYKYHIKIENFI